jgi:chemotaxis protein MotB
MSRKQKHKHHEEEGGEAWLLPYSDLMTLLLAVFIVLFAVSKVDETKAEQISEAFREGMMTESERVIAKDGNSVIDLPIKNNEETPHSESHDESNAGSESEEELTKEETETAEDVTPQEEVDASQDDTDLSHEELEEFLGQYELSNLEELKKEIDTKFENENMADSITTSIDTRGLVISLNNAILFGSGSADIKKENKFALKEIARIINELDNYIRIEGHTDNIPINTRVYPSNWELSTARASSVVRYFIEDCKVPPKKVSAVGYGEYKPIANNSTEKGRQKNRRIDIIVLSEKYNNLED